MVSLLIHAIEHGAPVYAATHLSRISAECSWDGPILEAVIALLACAKLRRRRRPRIGKRKILQSKISTRYI